METAIVRQRVTAAIERAKRAAQERRTRTDEAAQAFPVWLEKVAVPVLRQIAGALKAAGYPFAVHTPSGAVRLASERAVDDFIELSLDPQGDDVWVVGRTRRARGRRVLESERPVRRCPVEDLTEEDVLTFVLKELEPFVER
jgi:hypothetical protein